LIFILSTVWSGESSAELERLGVIRERSGDLCDYQVKIKMKLLDYHDH
jgi:hypothetical protein